MTGNVTCTTRVLILQPSTTNVAVLLIDDMFDILARLLDMVGHQDTRHARANSQDFELAIGRILQRTCFLRKIEEGEDRVVLTLRLMSGTV